MQIILVQIKCYVNNLDVLSSNNSGSQELDCNFGQNLGVGSFDTPSTYTFAYMRSMDYYGIDSGQINQDNPFDIPNVVYTGG